MSKTQKYILSILGCVALGILGGGCGKPKQVIKSAPRPKTEKKSTKEPVTTKSEGNKSDVSHQIETVTEGAHARIVWNQSQDLRDPDTFSSGKQQFLMGIDSRDGQGQRILIKERGNYTRPLISTDGKTILYTSRRQYRKGRLGIQEAEIFRSDWNGSSPIRVTEGWAVQCWRDPSSGIEWVYAVNDWSPTGTQTPDPKRLFRFPLNNPEKSEVIYDETTLDPDSIQLSRDGLQASGGFPWPNAGIFTFDGKTVTTQKLLNGCWPSHSPDSSHVSWVFDGNHRTATFFANDSGKSWKVNFNPPETNGHEMYHPRWSNHPRYLVITGPYKSGKKRTNPIYRGGRSAEIYLGRFDAKLSKVEAWLEITGNSLGDNYPDAWIEGGDTAQLSGFGVNEIKSAKDDDSKLTWPTNTTDLVFLWRDHHLSNSWRTPDGHSHETRIECREAARFGPNLEMTLDGGDVVVEEAASQNIIQKRIDQPDHTFEALVLPPSAETKDNDQNAAHIFRSPFFSISMRQGYFFLSDHNSDQNWKCADATPPKPFQLAVIHRRAGITVFINGTKAELVTQDQPKSDKPDSLIFGGNWGGGLLNLALYQRALDASEVLKNTETARKRVVKFQPRSTPLKVRAKLLEVTAPPSPESITPYTSSLVTCLYEVEQVLSGELKEKRILVKQWGLLNRLPVIGFPVQEGKIYDLLLESESIHPELKGERVTDDTSTFDLEPWFDITPPRVIPMK